MKNMLRAGFVMLLALSVQFASAQNATTKIPKFKTVDAFFNWFAAQHKAPFDRDGVRLPPGAAARIMANSLRLAGAAALPPSGTNVKINRDRDPWPKAEIGTGIDPVTGSVVVMTNDFRENYDKMYFHVSTSGGATWTDDAMVGGSDPYSGYIPLTFQSDPGVAFDDRGHSFLSTITGNLILDFNNGYENVDTEVMVAQGFNHGTYANLAPITIDTQPCNGLFTGTFNCPAQLDKPLITVDSVAGSPNNGTIYVYYTVFCGPAACAYGSGSIPAFGSAIVESHSPGAGQPFSTPQIVSVGLSAEQFSSVVVDSHGVPHAFFDDFSSGTGINMYMSTLTSTGWVVSSTPVASFQVFAIASPNWGFRLSGTYAPGCGISKDTAYCAFSANQVGTGPVEGNLSAYVAAVNTQTGASMTARVNNDPFNDSKDHIFPWAATTANGSVYVGYYDDQDDPFLTKVKYRVAKSTDGGMTFPTQKAVSDVAFNPCVGFPGCGFFGDYTQLSSGPNGVYAAWTDSRDGVSQAIYGQAINW